MVLVFGEQGLAVDVDLSQFGVDQRLVIRESLVHLMLLPKGRELLAPPPEFVGQFAGAGARPHRAESCTERRDLSTALSLMVVSRIAETFARRVDEPTVDLTSFQADEATTVPQEFRRWSILYQSLSQDRDDERRRVRQSVEHPQQRRRDVVVTVVAVRRIETRDPEQVVTFVRGQPERTGQGTEDLGARSCTTPLFNPREVIRRHPRQQGDLLPAQAGCAASTPSRESDVGGLQRRTATREKGTKCITIHDHQYR